MQTIYRILIQNAQERMDMIAEMAANDEITLEQAWEGMELERHQIGRILMAAKNSTQTDKAG